MLKDVWDSLKENIKERTTNPFLGTFAVVWIVHNWKVAYAFFYFDTNWKLEKKIDYFNNYWKVKSFIGNLFLVAFVTIVILIITYFFLGLSRYLSNYFENIVIPYIHKISRGTIVTLEIHQNALKKIEALEVKVEAERKAKNEAMQERDLLEQRVYTKPEENYIEKDYSSLVEKLKNELGYNKPDQALLNISKGGVFKDHPVIDFLIKYNLIEFDKTDGFGNRSYKFTQDGETFKNQYFNVNDRNTNSLLVKTKAAQSK